jgi:hypothetical protein
MISDANLWPLKDPVCLALVIILNTNVVSARQLDNTTGVPAHVRQLIGAEKMQQAAVQVFHRV